jgi:hypothetical protein
MLSAAQARSMLEAVARAHLAKMERVAVMETADGVTADEGRSSDRVMGWVRRLQAAQGTAAIVGALERRAMAEYGLNQQEIDEVGQTLDLLRRASNGTSPRQRLVTFLSNAGRRWARGICCRPSAFITAARRRRCSPPTGDGPVTSAKTMR